MEVSDVCPRVGYESSPTNVQLVFLIAHTRLYTLPYWSVGQYVRPSVTFLNSEIFLHYCSCPTVRDWIAVYPALFFLDTQLHNLGEEKNGEFLNLSFEP